MMERSFCLTPFPASNIPSISLSGKLSFQKYRLTLHYSLGGDIQEVLLPPVSANPRRRDELWKATCFEFFLARKDQPGYWEFNLSPSGDWNVYRMDAYRRVGFREQTAISQLPFAFKKESDQFSLSLSIDLASLLRTKEALQMGITSIIRTKDGNETYWALAHPAPFADFHLRESFILELAGQIHPSEQSDPVG